MGAGAIWIVWWAETWREGFGVWLRSEDWRLMSVV